MGASRLVLGAVLLNTVVAATVAAALAAFAGQALGQAAQRRIETAPGVRVDMNGAMNLRQADADSASIRGSLRAAFGAIPVTLDRSLWSDSLALPPGQGAARPPARAAGTPVALLQAASPDRVRAMSALVTGAWPAGPAAGRPIPAALPSSAAAQLRLPVGSLLSVRDRSTGAALQFRLTGIFRPRDRAASYWGLNLIGASGATSQGGFITYGPLVVDPAAFTGGRLVTGGASWVALPDRQRIGGDLIALAGKITRMASAFSLSPRFGGLQVGTALPGLLAGLGADLVVARSLLVIGGLLVLVLVAGALALASRVLAGQREPESALLSARGGSPAQLARLNAAESGLLAVTAAVAGALLGGRLAAWLAATGPLRRARIRIGALPPAAWWAAAAAALACVAITLGPALRPPQPGSARVRRGRPARVAGVRPGGR